MSNAPKPVETLTAQVERRNFPRLRTDKIRVFADIQVMQGHAKIRVPVQELGAGGMLVKWEQAPTAVGALVPVSLTLENSVIPVSGTGKSVYEVSQGKRRMVGLEFVNLAPESRTRISRFVSEKLSKNTDAAGGLSPRRETSMDSETGSSLEVYFDDPVAFNKEYKQNMQYGGMFVPSAKAYKSDTKITLKIKVPGHIRQLILQGTVVTCSPLPDTSGRGTPFGVGIQFDGEPSLWQATIRDFLKSK